MFRTDRQKLVADVILALCSAVCLPLFMDWRSGVLGADRYCRDVLSAFTAAFTLGYLPFDAWGRRFARLCRARRSGWFFFLRVAVINLCMTVLMCLIMQFLDVGFSLGPAFFPVYLKNLPATLLFALAVSLAAFTIAPRISAALCTKPAGETRRNEIVSLEE